MSLAVPFWNYFWHIVGLVSILVICLPTFYWVRIGRRFALHRELVPEEVTNLQYGEMAVGRSIHQTLIEAYNQANFLYRKSYHRLDSTQMALTWDYHPRQESYTLYVNGPYVDVIKTRGKTKRFFTIQSEALRDWMNAHTPEREVHI